MSGTNQDPPCREGDREGVPKERVLDRQPPCHLPCEPSLTPPEDASASSQVLPEVLTNLCQHGVAVGFLDDILEHPWDRSSWRAGILFVGFIFCLNSMFILLSFYLALPRGLLGGALDLVGRGGRWGGVGLYMLICRR